MNLGLSNRVVLVTGGSSGIGRATAIAFGREKARVVITYHQNEEGASSTADEVKAAGGEAQTVRMDLGDDDSVRQAVDAAAAWWGGIDVLVNNAVEWPTPPQGPPGFAGTSPEVWRRTLRTALDGVVLTVQTALPAMKGRDHGRIVFLSSQVAEYGMPGEQVYAAAKTGLNGFVRCLAREVGPDGILANIVMPGLTLTERCERFVPSQVREAVAGQAATGRLSTPQDVAAVVTFLASAANGNITGEIVRVNGG